jgi:hypothetical protein
MLRAVGNKKLFLDKSEYEYYLQIKNSFNENYFNGLFLSDNDGIITAVTPSPTKQTPMVLIFFLLNVMMNQRLRNIDDGVSKISLLEKRLDKLEERLNELI